MRGSSITLLTLLCCVDLCCVAILGAPHPSPSPLSSAGGSTAISPGPARYHKRVEKGEKAVFAHVVQGVIQDYSQQDYEDDFRLAQLSGITAMALNVGHDSTDPAQMDKAFAAAEKVGIKLFFSFDMVYFSKPDGSKWIFDEYLKPYGASKAHYLCDFKVFVSTFSGEIPGRFLDNAGSLEESNTKWSALFEKVKSDLGLEIYFAPNWNDVATVASNSWGGAHMFWEAWPAKGSSDELSLDTTNSYLAECEKSGLDLVAPVGAFFQVHQRSDNNYVYSSSNFLLFYHYTALIKMDPGPQFIELLSWNDAGESHYLGPTRFDPPAGAEAYANAEFDHTPLLTASAYFNSWFIRGDPPKIKTESVVWYHRPHPKDLFASNDPVPKPEGADTLDDAIYVAVFVPSESKAASLVVTTGGKGGEPNAVVEGLNLVQVPLVPGEVGVELVDSDGKSLLSGKGVPIDSSIELYNFNYRAYILPEGADTSTLFDTSSSGPVSNEQPVQDSSKTSNGSATSSSKSSPGEGSTATRESITTSSAIASDGHRTASTTETATVSMGSSGSAGTGGDMSSIRADDDPPALLQSLSGSWLGLKIYYWLAMGVTLILAVLVYIIVSSHGAHSPNRLQTEQEYQARSLLKRSGGGDTDGEESRSDSEVEDRGRRRR